MLMTVNLYVFCFLYSLKVVGIYLFYVSMVDFYKYKNILTVQRVKKKVC